MNATVFFIIALGVYFTATGLLQLITKCPVSTRESHHIYSEHTVQRYATLMGAVKLIGGIALAASGILGYVMPQLNAYTMLAQLISIAVLAVASLAIRAKVFGQN